MTRYAIDATVALQLADSGVDFGSRGHLVSASRLRSDAMSILYRRVRDGSVDERRARELLDSVTTMRIRLLGDRVSRSVAWKIAGELGWDDPGAAEYLAVAKLQADVFITLDPALQHAASSYVTTGSIDELYA